MIGTFWNLCRACPSLPIDKTRAEYRSSYQWYEYKGSRRDIIKQAPKLSSPTRNEESYDAKETVIIPLTAHNTVENTCLIDNAEGMQQHSELNIKPNPIFGKKDSELKETNTDSINLTNKSNGGIRVALIRNCPDNIESETSGIPLKGPEGNTEYRLQFAWPKIKAHFETQSEGTKVTPRGRKCVLMASSNKDTEPVPVHKKRVQDTNKKEDQEPLMTDQDNNQQSKRAEFYSEYKKKFRPFSQYDYISGRYLAREGELMTSTDSLPSASPWYQEVIELRKKAGEYRHRGWGVELAPEHLSEVYNKQIALWEHVSRRSSLSALTLATTTQKPRLLVREEKKQNGEIKSVPGKLRRQVSSDRGASIAAQQRKGEKTDEGRGRHRRDIPIKHTFERATAGSSARAKSKGRSQSVGPRGATPSKANVVIKTPSSKLSPSKSTTSDASTGEIRHRPTSLATIVSSDNKCEGTALGKKKDRLTFKVENRNQANKNDKFPTSGIKDKEQVVKAKKSGEKLSPYEHMLEPIVKSPPEPTRVRSPDQIMMKSPEPINWTVPLDRNRTLIVTQSIPEDAYIRPGHEMRTPSPHRIGKNLLHAKSADLFDTNEDGNKNACPSLICTVDQNQNLIISKLNDTDEYTNCKSVMEKMDSFSKTMIDNDLVLDKDSSFQRSFADSSMLNQDYKEDTSTVYQYHDVTNSRFQNHLQDSQIDFNRESDKTHYLKSICGDNETDVKLLYSVINDIENDKEKNRESCLSDSVNIENMMTHNDDRIGDSECSSEFNDNHQRGEKYNIITQENPEFNMKYSSEITVNSSINHIGENEHNDEHAEQNFSLPFYEENNSQEISNFTDDHFKRMLKIPLNENSLNLFQNNTEENITFDNLQISGSLTEPSKTNQRLNTANVEEVEDVSISRTDSNSLLSLQSTEYETVIDNYNLNGIVINQKIHSMNMVDNNRYKQKDITVDDNGIHSNDDNFSDATDNDEIESLPYNPGNS